jgi:hypothetical protein
MMTLVSTKTALAAIVAVEVATTQISADPSSPTMEDLRSEIRRRKVRPRGRRDLGLADFTRGRRATFAARVFLDADFTPRRYASVGRGAREVCGRTLPPRERFYRFRQMVEVGTALRPLR